MQIMHDMYCLCCYFSAEIIKYRIGFFIFQDVIVICEESDLEFFADCEWSNIDDDSSDDDLLQGVSRNHKPVSI